MESAPERATGGVARHLAGGTGKGSSRGASGADAVARTTHDASLIAKSFLRAGGGADVTRQEPSSAVVGNGKVVGVMATGALDN